MTDDQFGLTEDEFWTNPGRTSFDVAQRLWAEGRDTLAVAAPKTIPLDLRETAPVIVHRAGPYKALWTLPSGRAVLIAVDTGKNEMFAGLLTGDEENADDDDEDATGEIPEGNTANFNVVDLRRIGVPWQAGRYVVSVILRDQVSNRIGVKLGNSERSYHDEAVAEFLANQGAVAPTPTVFPLAAREGVPSYAHDDRSPPVPDEPGIALSPQRVTVLEAGARCLLHGSFRLPVCAHEQVRRDDRVAIFRPDPEPAQPAEVPAANDADAPTAKDVDAPGAHDIKQPTAVVGITLLATRSDRGNASVYRMDVPSWDVLDPANPIATGTFTIDLLEEKILDDGPQTYFIYAFCGEIAAGPAPAALVDEAALPGRAQR